MIIKSENALYLNRTNNLEESIIRNDNKYKIIFNQHPNNLYQIENKDTRFGSESFLTLSPFLQHKQLKVIKNKHLIEINPLFISNMKKELNCELNFFDLPVKTSPHLSYDFKRFARLMDSNISVKAKNMYLESFITQLLIDKMMNFNIIYKNNEHQKIKEYIEGNYMDDLTLQSMADTFSYSKYHLIKIFKVYFNMTPIEYLNQIRITKSLELINKNNLTFTAISYIVGYSSYNQFSKWFKHFTFLSPSQYEERYRR